MRVFRSSRGVIPAAAASAPAVPAACPVHAQVAITRAEVNATCELEMFLPAISMLSMLRLNRDSRPML